mmetsp:Transcript_15630/g.36907  ORF Transcript_15630/g.36907 Transcript_15630/m.36907 type:complete len:301 (-) Transcript_15630:469-1371(-)
MGNDVLHVPVDVDDNVTVIRRTLQHRASSRALDDPTPARNDPLVGLAEDTAEQLCLCDSERVPTVRCHEVADGGSKLGRNRIVQVHKLQPESQRQGLAKRRLSTTAHANQNNVRVRPYAAPYGSGFSGGALRDEGQGISDLDAKPGDVVPELRVRLLDTVLLRDYNSRNHAAEDCKGHSDAVVVVAHDASAVELREVAPAALDFNPVGELPNNDPALAELLDHNSDAVAFLGALVRDIHNAGGPRRNRSDDTRSHERICHVTHVDFSGSNEATGLRGSDSRGICVLLDSAAHLLQQTAEV